MRDEFQQRRDVFVAGLNRIPGFSCRVPKGAFTSSPTSRKLAGRRRSWPTLCWKKPEWLVFPGQPSGNAGEGYLRFSVANSLENLNKALDRIEQWVKKNL